MKLGAAESSCGDQGFADVQSRWQQLIETLLSPSATKNPRTVHTLSPPGLSET